MLIWSRSSKTILTSKTKRLPPRIQILNRNRSQKNSPINLFVELLIKTYVETATQHDDLLVMVLEWIYAVDADAEHSHTHTHHSHDGNDGAANQEPLQSYAKSARWPQRGSRPGANRSSYKGVNRREVVWDFVGPLLGSQN